MKDFSDLTDRQKQILDYLRSMISLNGYPPSVREICDAVGLSSTSSVHSHLNSLEAKGYIKRDAASARALTVLDDTFITENNVTGNADDPFDHAVALPLLGRVAAGEPILAEQNIEDTLVLPSSIVGDSSSFLLQIHGESMIDAGIYDGDYVVVKEQNTANNGEIVVALLDDSATVKTFYKEKDYIRLQPQNSTMSPIIAQDVQILGKVTALLRAM